MIRKLKLNDLEEVFELLDELYENKIEYSIFIEKYKECLKDNNFYGIVAVEDNKVVGVLISHVINRLAKKKDILFIDDLIVNGKYRNTGIGKLLIQDVTNYAMSKDCGALELTSMIENVNAHRFYEKNGFEKRQYKFKKYLKMKLMAVKGHINYSYDDLADFFYNLGFSVHHGSLVVSES